MSFLLAEPNGADLGVRKDTDDSAVLLELLKLCLDALLAVCILLGIPRERLLLALVPVEKRVDRKVHETIGWRALIFCQINELCNSQISTAF